MKATIQLTVEAPTDCTPEQFREWLQYQLGETSSISMDNPLVDESMSNTDCTIDIED